jgi:elongation factor Ts
MQQVKELRDRTSAGLNDCRSALIESEGDMEKAVEVILKKGLAKSAKRAGAVATEGEVAALVSDDGASGAIVEVNIQTDFAARNDDFRAFVKKVLSVAGKASAGTDLGGVDGLEEERKALVGKLGENVVIRRFEKLSVSGPGKVAAYVHMGGKIGVLVALKTGNVEAAKKPGVAQFAEDIAIQVTAMSPLWLAKSDVPEGEKNKQREIFDAQLAEEGKPEAVRPKIVEGKLQKWMKEVCLLEQASVQQSDKSIDELRAALAKELGTELVIEKFVRFQLGEGIEKPTGDDFASEVAKMAGS